MRCCYSHRAASIKEPFHLNVKETQLTVSYTPPEGFVRSLELDAEHITARWCAAYQHARDTGKRICEAGNFSQLGEEGSIKEPAVKILPALLYFMLLLIIHVGFYHALSVVKRIRFFDHTIAAVKNISIGHGGYMIA